MKNKFYALALALTAFCPVLLAQTWSNRQNMPDVRMRHCSEVGVDASGIKRVYVFAGGSESQAKSSVYGYHPATDTWTSYANLPTPRVDATSAVLNGLIYVIGGRQGGTSNAMNDVNVYDPASDSWSTAANLPITTSVAAAATYNGKLYVFGGMQPNQFNTWNRTYEYDPATNSWTQKANMPGAASSISAVTSCRGKIYVIGNNVNYEYTPSTNTWVTKTAAPTSQQGRAVVIGSDQRIYLINDRNYNTSSDPVVYYYRYTNDTWYQATDNLKGYIEPAATHMDRYMYLTGGTVRFSPDPTRVERSSRLLRCFCWGNMVVCMYDAEPIGLSDFVQIGEISDGGGVGLETGNSSDVTVKWDKVRAHEGSTLTFSGDGMVAGKEGTRAGELFMAQDRDTVTLQADFSSVDASSWRAEVYDQGKLILTVAGEGALMGATSDAWPAGAGFEKSNKGEPTLSATFEQAAIINIDGREAFADEIRFVGEGGPGFDYVNSVDLRATRLDEITITDVEATEAR